MSKVSLKNIYMNYHSIKGETKAIDNISFDVAEGEFLSIVGPSGCGKSTILNIMSGLVKPSLGSILIDNQEFNSLLLKIGYMFQKDQLFEWLNVWNNVTIGLKIQHKISKDNIKKIEQLLRNYNLWEFIEHYPRELSGGMRQRVALIRTLALDPKVLLLDEPFSSLDYQSRLNASNEIFEIIKKENKTAIMVTHDISEAISMSDRIIVLSKRPAKIKLIEKINFSKEYHNPLTKREAPNFRLYFNKIWKELDLNE